MTTDQLRRQFGESYKEGGYDRTRSRLRRLGARENEAAELAQAAWLRGFERLGQLREDTNLRSWIDAIAVNLLWSASRSKREIDPLPEREPAGPSRISVVSIDVRRALQKCSPRQRRLLELVYMEGYSASEAAKAFGLSIDAVYSQLARARRVFRNHYEGSSEEHSTPRHISAA